MADNQSGVKVFVGPANQLELGTVAQGPAQVTLETISESKQRINFTIPSPTQELVDAAEAAQDSAAQSAAAAELAATAPTDAMVQARVDIAVPPAVTSALAADNTVKDAAAAAVTSEIETRDLLEGRFINPEVAELVFAVTDENDLRTWIEADLQGKPSPYATAMIVEKVAGPIADQVGADIGLEEMSSAITDLAFVVVDENGLRTEIEVGTDGKFTQRVIDSLKERLELVPEDVTTATRIITPAALPMLVGQTYKLYFADFIDALDKNHTVLTSSSSNGVNYGDRWQYTPDVAKSFNLALTVVDPVGNVIKTKTIAITVYAAVSGAGKRIMPIGDSITRAGNYAGLAATAVGATTVGTRTYNNAALNVEGRGGWTLSGYMTRIGHATLGDSPFLFPVGVAGSKFWGNTNFWKQVCYTAPNDYDFMGFQYIARGWKPAGTPYLFDVDGYPVAPGEGDVVVDPTKAAGQTFRQYQAGAWVTMAPQPAIEFSFSKYMDRYSAAFAGGGPTHISIMLETNDFYNGIDDAAFDAWKASLDAVIASIRAWSPAVPFVILLAATGGEMYKWAAQGDKNKHTFDRRMREAAAHIIAAYDTSAARTNKVYMTTFLGAITITNMADYVHPDTVTGHAEMSPYFAGMLAKFITEGV